MTNLIVSLPVAVVVVTLDLLVEGGGAAVVGGGAAVVGGGTAVVGGLNARLTALTSKVTRAQRTPLKNIKIRFCQK